MRVSKSIISCKMQQMKVHNFHNFHFIYRLINSGIFITFVIFLVYIIIFASLQVLKTTAQGTKNYYKHRHSLGSGSATPDSMFRAESMPGKIFFSIIISLSISIFFRIFYQVHKIEIELTCCI